MILNFYMSHLYEKLESSSKLEASVVHIASSRWTTK